MRALALALLAGWATGAQAHGGGAPVSPWMQGGLALFSEPSVLLLLMALVLLQAQSAAPPQRLEWRAGGAGLLLGAGLAVAGVVLDLGLPLLGLALLLGGLVAWARPLPLAVRAGLAAAAGTGAVLMLAPADTPDLAFRLNALLAVLAVVAVTVALGLGLLRALLRRRRGAVALLLLRVAGSWLATAALLAAVLEISRRWG